MEKLWTLLDFYKKSHEDLMHVIENIECFLECIVKDSALNNDEILKIFKHWFDLSSKLNKRIKQEINEALVRQHKLIKEDDINSMEKC